MVLVSAGFSQELNGVIISDTGKPVADATVVLLETDDIAITEADGSFILYLIPDGTFTILVSVPGFIEKEFPGLELTNQPLTLQIEPEVVEMDTITVKAEPKKAAAEINDGVTAEELERLPVGADPFDAAALEDGVLGELNILSALVSDAVSTDYYSEDTVESAAMPERRLKTSDNRGVSVYGGESDWNNYYYDYIRLPSNKHAYGSPVAETVIPREAVDSVGIYKGASPVEYGPAIGGTFVLNPVEPDEGWVFTVTPSTSEVSGLIIGSFTPELSLLVSLTQSILNYTTLPLLSTVMTIEGDEDMNEDDMPTDLSYGDALISLRYTPPNHKVSVDLLGFYDSFKWDLEYAGSEMHTSYLPFFVSAGSKWVWSLNPDMGNTVYAFGSLYQDTADISYHLEDDESLSELDYAANYLYQSQSFQAGEEFQINFGQNHFFIAGVNTRLSKLIAAYNDSQNISDEAGTVIAYFENHPKFDDLLFTSYGYGKIFGTSELFNYHTGAGVLWYPESNAFRPAVDGELVYSADKLSLAMTAGWSPGIIDEFSLIERRIDEIYYEAETITDFEQPPMAVSGSFQSVYELNDNTLLKATPYFAWYYDLTGANMNTSYSDVDNTLIALEPDRGYSTGIDLSWKSKLNSNFDLSLTYAFAWTRYLTDDYGWIPPNTEVQNALKGGMVYKKGKFRLGMNLFVYSGQPFTPVVIKDSLFGIIETSGDYNSVYNYLPTYELNANLSYGDESLSFFFKTGNLIDGLNFSGFGLKETLQETPGATTANFSSRNYTYDYTWTDLLVTLIMCELGFSISF